MSPPRADLIEAYIGRHKDDLELRLAYHTELASWLARGDTAVMSYEGWLVGPVRRMIELDTPRERLAIYLEWNGIIGYTGAIFAIATGQDK